TKGEIYMTDKFVKETAKKMSELLDPIDAVDINGRPLHLLESLYCDGYNSVILWSIFSKDYVAMNNDGGWLTREDMANGEHVLFTQETHWDDVNETISKLHETEAESVMRLVTSHYNMNALFEGAMQCLKEIAKTTQDKGTQEFAEQKIAFIKSLIPRG
ncbi:hypothetical protein, partial [Paenibacillus polymyxa]|uniref:hypothetical protein n=1 Tax=Paenibacillus polymyxa TaxID=1406 RepID=UPI003D2845C6